MPNEKPLIKRNKTVLFLSIYGESLVCASLISFICFKPKEVIVTSDTRTNILVNPVNNKRICRETLAAGPPHRTPHTSPTTTSLEHN